MSDFATLGMDIDSTGLTKGQRELRNLEKTGARTEGKLTRSASAISGVWARLGGVIAGALSVREIARAADAYTEMTNVMRVLGHDAKGAADRLQDVADIAKRTRAPLESTAQLFQRVSIASQDLGASQQDVLRFTENVGLALAQQGGSAAQASGALLQLSQAIAGGTVRAEEFNSILEGAFPIAQAAADGIDEAAGSVAKLRNMVIEGKVSSDAFFSAILSQTDDLEDAFKDTIPTIGQAFSLLRGSFTMFIGQMNSATGVSSTFAQAIITLANNIGRVVSIAATAAVAYGTTLAGAFIAARRASFSLVGSLTMLRTALIKTGVGALVVIAGELVYQFVRLVEKTGGVGGAFTALKDVAVEAFSRIPDAWDALQFKMTAASLAMGADFRSALADMLESVSPVANGILKVYVSSYESVVAAWGTLGQAFAALGAKAINALVKVVSIGVQKLLAPLNAILEAVNLDAIEAPDLSSWEMAVPEVQNVGDAIAGVMADVAQRDYFGKDGSITGQIRGVADEMRAASKTAQGMSSIFMDSATKPLDSLKKLRDVVDGEGESGGSTEPGAPSTAGAGGVGAGGAAGDGLIDKLKTLNGLIGRVQEQDPREKIEAWHSEAMTALMDANLIERGMMQEHNEYKLEIERLYQDQLTALRRKERSARLGETADMFGALAKVAQAGGAKMAKIAAVASGAQTMMAAYEAAMKAAAEAKTIPGRLAAYAMFVAKGFETVQAINKAGGVAGGVGGGGGAPAAGGATAAEPATVTNITLEGETFSRESVQQLLTEQLQGEIDRGGRIIFS